MNITPERAKALSGIVREYGIYNLTSYEKEEISSIVHHYAEILPKWQAVLDAEPVAESYAHHSAGEIGYCEFFTNVDRGELLIIKPAP